MNVTLHFEASEMGWAPGHWPYRFSREGVEFVLVDWDDNNTHYYSAEHDSSKKVVIFND